MLKVEKIQYPILVTSTNFFNQSQEIIACPIIKNSEEGPLHIAIHYDDTQGIVHCEKLHLFDIRVRGYKKIGNIPISEIKNVTDTIQGIFDYIW